ncbi:WW domain-containing transcription regulator protein 1-like [Saccopteryx leptura]|uniref:WW domain-containing transcription regulator protein 1-like n=1 Tax=Saccopteryx leptura TaxID=249018 RepID=UPI00339C2801
MIPRCQSRQWCSLPASLWVQEAPRGQLVRESRPRCETSGQGPTPVLSSSCLGVSVTWRVPASLRGPQDGPNFGPGQAEASSSCQLDLEPRDCGGAGRRPCLRGVHAVVPQGLGGRNHIEKITTWHDPRKVMSQPLSHMSLHPAATSTPAPQRSMAVSQPNLVMSHPQQQQQQQMAPSTLSQPNHPSQNPPAGLLSVPNALTTQQQQQQKLRLQRIQMERERIRMRQEELMRQEAALCRQLPMEAETLATVQAAVSPPAMTPDMRSVTNNSSDPFLNGGPYHSREQSTDSGLGLGCYSVPTTPEDFLSNVDEMDTGDSAGQTPMNINPQQTRFPDFLDCLPGTNVDLGTLESEDLIPLFNDVESALNKSEPFLTWL